MSTLDLKSIVTRGIGIFVVVGLGLGIGTIIFLQATGFFDAPTDGFGAAMLGVFTLAIVLVFSLMIGPIVGLIVAVFAARAAATKQDAVVSASVAGGLGHAAMVVALGVVLVSGIIILGPKSESTALVADDGPADWRNIAKLLFGVLPAAAVGGAAAALLFVQRIVLTPSTPMEPQVVEALPPQ